MVVHQFIPRRQLLDTTKKCTAITIVALLFYLIPSTASFCIPPAPPQPQQHSAARTHPQPHPQPQWITLHNTRRTTSTSLSFFFTGGGGENSTSSSVANSYTTTNNNNNGNADLASSSSSSTAVSAMKVPWSSSLFESNSMSESQTKALEAAEEVLINLRMEMVEQDKQLDAMKETLEQKTAQIDKLQQSLKSRDDILQRAFVTVENLETQNEQFSTQLTEMKEETRQLKQTNDAKEQQLQKTLRTLEEATTQIQILQKELVQVKQQQQQQTMQQSKQEVVLVQSKSSSSSQSNKNNKRLLELPKLELPKLEKEQIPVLNEWSMSFIGEVTGIVSKHPDIPDGETIVTSPLENPKLAARNKIVQTASGSKYKLGRKAPPQPKGDNTSSASTTSETSSSPTQITMTPDIPLTGEVVGDGKYLLAGKPKASKNGRSMLYAAYKSDSNDRRRPTGETLAIKISSNTEAMERENTNYQKVSKSRNGGSSFIERLEFLPVAGRARPTDRLKLSKKSALVMEMGKEDLKEYIGRQGEGLQGQALQDAALSALQCLEGLHSANLVWTDLKTENFVIMEEQQEDENGIVVKGIDLESAVKVKGNPVDYTPEACPPEFAQAFLDGEGIDFVLEYSYDAWSFGMLLYELCTGRGFFDGKTAVQITKLLPSFEPNLDDDDELDSVAADLISKCLQSDPKKRISISSIRKHPFFATSNSNPFNFLFG